MYINTCCGWESNTTYDLCPECKEHCDWELLDEDEVDIIALREAEEKLHNQ